MITQDRAGEPAGLYPARSWRTAASIAPLAPRGHREDRGVPWGRNCVNRVPSPSSPAAETMSTRRCNCRGTPADGSWTPNYVRPMLGVLDEYCLTCAVMMAKECGQVSECHIDRARSQGRP